jgi:DNA polymerase III subunit chi
MPDQPQRPMQDASTTAANAGAAAGAAAACPVPIDFHVNVEHPVIHACRVVRKALSQQRTVLVFSRDALRLSRLDAALWTFSALDFLPHVYADSALADRTPVWLSLDAPPERARDVLLLFDEQAAPAFERWFGRFGRVIEIVSNEERDRAQARARFKAYRERGFAPCAHEIPAT